jgi:hypothetical protein
MTDTGPLASLSSGDLWPTFGAHALQPNRLRAVYGARWIVTQDGHVDMVPGRGGVEGDADNLLHWLNALGGPLNGARRTAERLLQERVLDTRKRSPVILFQDRFGVIVADTNASAGYLYVTGWLFEDLPADRTTNGLDKVLDAIHEKENHDNED